MSDVKNSIWVTSKARMFSEKRYLSYDLATHLIMNSLSVVLLITSIYPEEIGKFVPGLSKINVASSLLLFSATLLLYGFKFGEKAAKHRECYLKLQELYAKDLGDCVLSDNYSKILEIYPNHESRDYFDVLVERKLKQKDPVKNIKTGSEQIVGFWVIMSYFGRRILFSLLCHLLPFSIVIMSFYALMG